MPKFLRDLKSFYKTQKRDLPWRPPSLKVRRGKADPYKILVSEVMLQQTQALRVVPKYEAFIKKFPTAQKLAKAKLSVVLGEWSGLGYNRRAKFLHQAAKVIAKEGFTGQKLPGVGPYTAAAVAAFAHNKPTVFIETNIRTVFIHHGMPSRLNLDILLQDKEILPFVARALRESRMQPRDFYAALMDYGSYLKQKGIKLNSRSKHYTKQSKFKGSYRELRGAIVRLLLKGPQTYKEIVKATGRPKKDVAPVLTTLTKEGMIKIKNHRFAIVD